MIYCLVYFFTAWDVDATHMLVVLLLVVLLLLILTKGFTILCHGTLYFKVLHQRNYSSYGIMYFILLSLNVMHGKEK